MCRHLDVKWVDVVNILAGYFVGVVLYAEEVEQMFLILREAGPQDEDISLVDGRRAAVLHVVDVENLLTDLVLEVILVRNVLRAHRGVVENIVKVIGAEWNTFFHPIAVSVHVAIWRERRQENHRS